MEVSSGPVRVITEQLDRLFGELNGIEQALDELCGGQPRPAGQTDGPKPVPSGRLREMSEHLSALVTIATRSRERLMATLG